MDDKTQELYIHAKERMPGGTQLLSKRPEMFAPDQWPGYFTRAKGCEVWDLDGNHYYDMTTNGIGSCLLGYADEDVNAAVIERVKNGSMSTLNPPEEVELADRLCRIHPWAEQVRFARTGGEIMSVAVRIARATTGRSAIAICGYHGWSDWYLAANLGEDDSLSGHLLPGLDPLGVPSGLRGSAQTFRFNDRAAFDALIDNFGDKLAAVVMEPVRYNGPDAGFLEHIRKRTSECGALLVFDEITIGWRLTFGGSHLVLGVTPDLAVFAKALGNGHPIAAVIGSAAAMDGAHRSFISSTYWTESVGPVAALATIEKMEKTRVWEHARRIGTAVGDAWRVMGAKHGLNISVGDGYPCLAHFAFSRHPLELKTLYTALMLKRGFLGNTAIYPTLAHTDEIVELYAQAIDAVFGDIANVVGDGYDVDRIMAAIGGPVAHEGFRRLN